MVNICVVSSAKKLVHIGRIRRPEIIGLPLLLICGSALGQHMNAKDAPCRGPSSTLAEAQCLTAAQAAADEGLNLTYRKILSKIDPKERVALTKAERLWIEFRDANCRAERVLYGGGSGAPIAFLACMEAETRQRTNDLLVMYGWRLGK